MKNYRWYFLGGGAAVSLLVLLFLWSSFLGHNNDQTWQIYQSPFGEVTVVDSPGYYTKFFGTTWTYPRTLKAWYSNHPDEREDNKDDSIRVTFNDSGTAQINSYVMVQLPTTTEHRRRLHQDFQANPANIISAVRGHLVNCMKASGPVMSASENQAARKAEFNNIVEEQLSKGLFKMRRTETELEDVATLEEGRDEAGNKVSQLKRAKVQATEIVHDATTGKPIVIQPSPLEHYGIVVLQFSITDTEYDAKTLAQFEAKKESFLAAERAKAQKQEEVSQRLMVEEKGRRQVAEIQAEENQKKERALIQAQQAADVATIDKQRAVTVAQQQVEVAQKHKVENEMLRDIAKVKAETAELEKKAAVSQAEGRQKSIELGGGLSERDRVLAEIAAERDAKVAAALAGVRTPEVVIVGGGEAGKGQSLTENLLNMALLKSTGVLRESPPKSTPVPPPVAKQ